MSATWKLGPHVRPNNSDHAKDAQLIAIEWPWVTWAGNPSAFWWLEQYHAAHPNAKIGGRFFGSDGKLENLYKSAKPTRDPGITGHDYAHALLAANVPKYVYWRTDELTNDYDWICRFNLAVMEVLIPAGYRWCSPSFPEGNPKQPPFDSVDEWVTQWDLMHAVNAYGPEFALMSVNGYRADDFDPAHLTRFEHPYKWCEDNGLSNVYWTLGETGVEIPLANSRPSDAQQGDEWEFNHALGINQKLAAFPKLIGAAWYDFSTLANGTVYRTYGPFFDMFIRAGQNNPPAPAPEPTPPPAGIKRYKVVSANGVNIRTEPSTASTLTIKGSLPVGFGPFEAQPNTMGWVIIRTEGHTYYVAQKLNGITYLEEL